MIVMQLFALLSIAMIALSMRAIHENMFILNRTNSTTKAVTRSYYATSFPMGYIACHQRRQQPQQQRHLPSNTLDGSSTFNSRFQQLLTLKYRCTSSTNHQLQRPSSSSYSSMKNILVRTMSVSGIIYDTRDDGITNVTKQPVSSNNEAATSATATTAANGEAVVITLFTKEGCTLCDKVQSILAELRGKYPHTLIAVDITDPIHSELWYERYKYDIPVLHVNQVYWAKHRITTEQAEHCFQELQLQAASVTPIGTEPNAINSRTKGNTKKEF